MDERPWWRGFGLRLTVGLVMLVAVLSVATGILKITQQSVTGPLATLILPAVQETVGFTGALTGFLMIGSALGLRRGLRSAWWSTLVLLPVTALQGLLQSSPVSLPLVLLSAIAIPNVLAHRDRFDRRLDLTQAQLAALVAIVGAQVYGTVGTYALRDAFANVETPVDAFYYTIVTASTVGYGDAVPQTAVAKLFGMSVLVVGTASFAIALGTLFGPAIEARFQRALGRMTDSQLDLLEDHILVLGHGDLTEVMLEELVDVDYLVVTPDGEWANSLGDRPIDVFVADPSDEEPLRRAQLADATAVVTATNNDAEDALAVLTARQLRPNVRIVAAATDRENVKKLKRAGADTVISPAVIGGHLLVESALGRGDTEDLADKILKDEGPSDRTE